MLLHKLVADVTEENGYATITVDNENETILFSAFAYGDHQINYAQMGDVVVISEAGVKNQAEPQSTLESTSIVSEEEFAAQTNELFTTTTSVDIEPKKESLIQQHFGKITFAALLVGGLVLAKNNND